MHHLIIYVWLHEMSKLIQGERTWRRLVDEQIKDRMDFHSWYARIFRLSGGYGWWWWLNNPIPINQSASQSGQPRIESSINSGIINGKKSKIASLLSRLPVKEIVLNFVWFLRIVCFIDQQCKSHEQIFRQCNRVWESRNKELNPRISFRLLNR